MTNVAKSSEESSNVFVIDTNVWLDYLLGHRPCHQSSYRLIVEALQRNITLVIPSHSVKDVFFIFQQELRRLARAKGDALRNEGVSSAKAAAWAAIENIMGFAAVGPTDQSDAWIALKQRTLHSDYEDNLVIATAMRLNARLLVTNDEQLIRHSPVATLSAADALSLIRSYA